MSKNLKKIFVTGAALLMFASVGASANSNTNVSARHVRTHKVINNAKHGKKHIRANKSRKAKKSYRNHKRNARLNKRTRKMNGKRRSHKTNRRSRRYNKRNKRNALNKKVAKRLNKKARRKSRRNKRAKKVGRILKPRYRRSNSRRLLDQSGFVDLNKISPGTPEIVSHYAPNNRKAVIPKKLNVNSYIWLQGNFPQQNLKMYQYVSARHGWVNFADNL